VGLTGGTFPSRQDTSMDIRYHRAGNCTRRLGICTRRLGICTRRLGICTRRLGICNHRVRICNHHVGICNLYVGIDCQVGLKGGGLSLGTPNRANRTHVEDVENPDEVLFPSHNLLLIALREDGPGHRISFTTLDDHPLDPRQCSAIGRWITRRAYLWFDSQIQISNRMEGGLVEFIQPSPLQSLVELKTHVVASPHKVDEILIVEHRVLGRREPEVYLRRMVGGTHSNHSQEDASGSEGDFSCWYATGVFCDVQSLNEHI
jgi:hypothetical protein